MTDEPSARIDAPRPVPDDDRSAPRKPADYRHSVALTVLAVIGCLFVLHWASQVFIPLMLGVVFSHALTPAVNAMAKRHLPRAIGAAVLLLGLVGAIGGTAYSLGDDAAALLDSLPQAAQKLKRALQAPRKGGESTLAKVEQAAVQLERATMGAVLSTPAAKGVTRVQIERPKFNVSDYLWTGTLGLAGLVGQAVVIFFITYFLLVSGDTFRRKFVRIAGPTFSQKKITVQALDEISDQIRRYLLVQLLTSTMVGVATGVAFAVIGVQHAAVWGVVAALLNFVPYVGSIAVTGATAVFALLQFGTLEMAMLVASVSLVINSLEGYLLTPWLTSRASRINPVMIFVGVLAWGWLWGLWGLFLGVPILMVIKSVCDRVEDWSAVGELMGE